MHLLIEETTCVCAARASVFWGWLLLRGEAGEHGAEVSRDECV